MASPNVLQLGVILDSADANSKITQLNKQLDSIGDSGEKASQRLTGGLNHSVTSVQATSAALRVLEGNMQNNLRAAERFLANTLGLGEALKAAFPVVGAVALGGVMSELIDKGQKLYEW